MSDKFEYIYEAPTKKERDEVLNIKNQYIKENETPSKVDVLKKLDKKVKNLPTIISLTIGIIGTLIFGVSMCFFLEWTALWYLGIPFGIIGIFTIIIAYPIYKKILDKLKNRYSSQIIKLADEILNETK